MPCGSTRRADAAYFRRGQTAVRYFDCDAVLGRPIEPPPHFVPSLADMHAEMEMLDVARALVRHRACADIGPDAGNRMLTEEVKGDGRLVPAWMVAPEGLRDYGGPEQTVDAMLSAGARAAWVKPEAGNYVFEPWCCKAIFNALAERAVPLLARADEIAHSRMHQVLEAFPRLPVIALRPVRQGRHREFYALLERHENLYLAVTPSYSAHRGVEDLCATFGPDRLLFGSGYPDVAGGAGLCMLSYAEISDECKEAIAHGNLERLIAEAHL